MAEPEPVASPDPDPAPVPDPDPVPGPDPDPEAMPDPDPEAVPDPDPEGVPNPDPEAVPNPDLEAVPVPVPDPDPVPVPEPVLLPGPMLRSAWKLRVRVRVAEAVSHLGAALSALEGATIHLEDPLSVANDDEAETRTTIEFLMTSFKAASHHLIVFSALAQGAEILALHAASDDPTRPLPYIHHLGDHEVALQSALARLHRAMGRTMDAYRSVQCSRGHLATALVLLDHPSLPCFETIIDRERYLTLFALENAVRDTLFCITHVGLAGEDMDRANS